VIGGTLPVALAADWLVSTWDQNAGRYATSPAVAVIEEVTARWLLELFGLPSRCGVGFVTGAQMANFTCLLAARHAAFLKAGWRVGEDGLQGAPPLTVVLGGEAHVTVERALGFLGVGSRTMLRVEADEEGRMRPSDLKKTLARCNGPTIVCAQVGNVNTGAFDSIGEIAPLVHEKGAWLHVDGAFGLWAATSSSLRRHLAGAELADSWATDAHKWLNVPYDSGIAIVADPDAHRASLTAHAPYLAEGDGPDRNGMDWVPESSRRARGVPIYAALKALGRRGVADLVEGCSTLARRMAATLSRARGVRILNDVVLNQVLVRFEPRGKDPDLFTRSVIARVQQEGTCWLGGTRWRGMGAMRISVTNWSTTESDIDLSAAAILDAARALGLSS
jgi:glutamate/tyrosine decarboxylase-like PLP-dependent enzyme